MFVHARKGARMSLKTIHADAGAAVTPARRNGKSMPVSRPVKKYYCPIDIGLLKGAGGILVSANPDRCREKTGDPTVNDAIPLRTLH